MDRENTNGDRPRVLVTQRLPSAVERELSLRFAADLSADDHILSEDDLVAAAREYDALLPTVTNRLTPRVFGAATRLKIAANFGVGVDSIDLDAARAAGVIVTNTPGVLAECTADLTMALILAVLRRIGEGERLVRAGQWTGWRPTYLLGRRVCGKTLGIIGFGGIGQAVARRAALGFGMPILVSSRRPPDPAALAAIGGTAVDLETLLGGADIVSLHCPLTSETRRLINAERLAMMGREAVLINTARGALVDEPALIAALESGRIAGAGLDVFDQEPLVPAGLLAMENVVVLPHLGSGTEETRTAMGMRALANLEAFFVGEAPPDRVV
ncbi:MAG: D-glycerate dehydrogenase [Gemmatimonadota bacterium]